MVKKHYIILLAIFAFVWSGCNPGIIEPPQAPVTDASAYFFPKVSTAPIVFADSILYPSRSFTTIPIYFDQADSSNDFFVTQKGVDSFACKLGTDAVTISGISTHSLIPLPLGFSIQTKRDSSSVTTPVPINHIIAVSAGLLASNDTAGIFYLPSGSQSWVHPTSTPFAKSNTITQFTVFKNTIFAATSSGALYYTSDVGSTWHEGSKYLSISAMYANSTALYIYDGSTLYRNTNPTSSQGNKVSIFQPIKITALAAVDDTLSSMEYIVASDEQGSLRYLIDTTNSSASLSWNTVPGINSVRTIIATPSGHFYCSTMSGDSGKIYSTPSQGNPGYWIMRDGSMEYALLAYCAGQVVAVTPSGAVHIISDQNSSFGKAVASISSGTNVNDLSAFGSSCYAATNQGIYQTTNILGQWSLVNSPSTSQTKYTETPGNITLLHSTGSSFDSSWVACTMVQYQKDIPLTITGRIIGNYDSLSIAGKTYSHLLQVRYSLENAGIVSTSIPYLQIFYAKDEGPVLIYQFANLSNMSLPSQKIYRMK